MDTLDNKNHGGFDKFLFLKLQYEIEHSVNP